MERWGRSERQDFEEAHKTGETVTIEITAHVNVEHDKIGEVCFDEEVTCSNNRATEEIVAR